MHKHIHTQMDTNMWHMISIFPVLVFFDLVLLVMPPILSLKLWKHLVVTLPFVLHLLYKVFAAWLMRNTETFYRCFLPVLSLKAQL